MRISGAILMGIGALIALIAFVLDTSVTSPGLSPYVATTSMHNLGLLQQQMMVLQTGLALFLAGAFLVGSGVVAERVKSDQPDEDEVIRHGEPRSLAGDHPEGQQDDPDYTLVWVWVSAIFFIVFTIALLISVYG